jgi:hypothetical protein
MYPLEKLRELREEVYDLPHDNDAELHSLALATEGLHDELQGDLLESAVNDAVLDNGSVELSYLLEVLGGILMQEAVFVEEGMEHASVYLLLLFKIRASELLH